MPFYMISGAQQIRLNLTSASSLYQPSDSSGRTCTLTQSGVATPFYANGTRIHYDSGASWHTIWTGSKSLGVSGTLDEFAYTTITVNELPASITSNTPFKMYATTNGSHDGDIAKWVTEDNEPQQFDYSAMRNNRIGFATASVWAPDYASTTSVTVTTRLDDQTTKPRVTPSIKVKEIQAYY